MGIPKAGKGRMAITWWRIPEITHKSGPWVRALFLLSEQSGRFSRHAGFDPASRGFFFTWTGSRLSPG
jgi:hypothetical protein